MSNGDKEQVRKDAKEKALEYAPKTPNKFMIWTNRFKKSPEDTQPSLQGCYLEEYLKEWWSLFLRKYGRFGSYTKRS